MIHAKPVSRRSWDFRAKDGFYIGPAMDSYRCFKLVKSDTKSQVISDTVEFRHAYNTIPTPSAEDKIINGLQVITNVLTDAPPPTSMSQIQAIENLSSLIDSWKSLGTPTSQKVPIPSRPNQRPQQSQNSAIHTSKGAGTNSTSSSPFTGTDTTYNTSSYIWCMLATNLLE